MAKELNYVDYKDIEYLQRYINEQGKILPRRVTNTWIGRASCRERV